jgi:hypothetical protein
MLQAHPLARSSRLSSLLLAVLAELWQRWKSEPRRVAWARMRTQFIGIRHHYIRLYEGSMKALLPTLLRLRGIAGARILVCMYCARESL